jgi:tryptophan synthase alpha subunit
VADGVVVGSAIVNCIAENLGNQKAIESALKDKMGSLLEANSLKR